MRTGTVESVILDLIPNFVLPEVRIRWNQLLTQFSSDRNKAMQIDYKYIKLVYKGVSWGKFIFLTKLEFSTLGAPVKSSHSSYFA